MPNYTNLSIYNLSNQGTSDYAQSTIELEGEILKNNVKDCFMNDFMV